MQTPELADSSTMPTTLLTGATGTLGTALRPKLSAAGHAVRAASRDPPTDDTAHWVTLDLTTGEGLDAALADVDVVVHAATAPMGDADTVDVEGTRRLLDAAASAGVSNVVYPSIVGIDEISYAYYDAKRAAETVLEDSAVPATVVRATQFHEFVAGLLDTVARLPIWPLPTAFELQPVAAGTVAERLVAHATPDPSGRVDPVCGPAVHTVGDLARRYREARGLRRLVVRLPLPGNAAAGFRAGHATAPDHATASPSWAQWLGERYGSVQTASGTPI